MSDRHAMGLIVNALTMARGETTDHWLQRNGLHAHLFDGLSCFLLAERGAPFAKRSDRFNGVTFGLLDIQLPVGMDLPSPHRRRLGICRCNVQIAQRSRLPTTLHQDLGDASPTRRATAIDP